VLKGPADEVERCAGGFEQALARCEGSGDGGVRAQDESFGAEEEVEGGVGCLVCDGERAQLVDDAVGGIDEGLRVCGFAAYALVEGFDLEVELCEAVGGTPRVDAVGEGVEVAEGCAAATGEGGKRSGQ